MPERMTVAEFRDLPARRRQRQPEQDVLDQVREYLRFRGWFVVRHHQSLGSPKGFPDLTALKNGETIYIECKTKHGRLTAAQTQFRQECERFGGRYLVARGIEDLEGL